MGPAGSTTPLEQDRSRGSCGPDQCKDRGTRLGLQRHQQWLPLGQGRDLRSWSRGGDFRPETEKLA